jgi:hypothetical protein
VCRVAPTLSGLLPSDRTALAHSGDTRSGFVGTPISSMNTLSIESNWYEPKLTKNVAKIGQGWLSWRTRDGSRDGEQ